MQQLPALDRVTKAHVWLWTAIDPATVPSIVSQVEGWLKGITEAWWLTSLEAHNAAAKKFGDRPLSLPEFQVWAAQEFARLAILDRITSKGTVH